MGRTRSPGRVLGPGGAESRIKLGSFLAALALGFVAGAIARALIPNDAFRHMHGWRSWLTSAGLGLLGALVGFSIFHGLFGIGDTKKFDWGGIVGAVIGAMIVVVVASFLIKRFSKTPGGLTWHGSALSKRRPSEGEVWNQFRAASRTPARWPRPGGSSPRRPAKPAATGQRPRSRFPARS